MGNCTDETVLSEVSGLLLQLLMDKICSKQMMESVTAVLGGGTEFAAFVLHRLIQRPSEDLRYLGIRLLTHYFLRCDGITALHLTRRGVPLIPGIAFTKTLTGERQALFAMLDLVVAAFTSVLVHPAGIDRLEASGGLSVLSQYLDMFKKGLDNTLLQFSLTPMQTVGRRPTWHFWKC
jgi:hypothetical protein